MQLSSPFCFLARPEDQTGGVATLGVACPLKQKIRPSI